MITLNFSPTRLDIKTEAALNGTVLTVNGRDFDLSEIPDGSSGSHETLLEFSRDGENYDTTIGLAHGANAPHETRFPKPVTISDGWELEYVYDEVAENDLAE